MAQNLKITWYIDYDKEPRKYWNWVRGGEGEEIQGKGFKVFWCTCFLSEPR